MCGAFTLQSKIFRGSDQAVTEDLLQEAIDENACHQRLFGRDQPLGKTESVAWCIAG